jgi:DNA-binding NtrC family response regulator
VEEADMQRALVLVLSDGPVAAEANGFVGVEGRERAAEQLATGRFRAICLDRTDLAKARSDAGWLRRRRNRLPVVALVEADQVAGAVELLGAGVAEIVVRDGAGLEGVLSRLAALAGRDGSAPTWTGASREIVAESPAMRGCLELVDKARRSEATVLLHGETGTGKEVIARALHSGSRRSGGPFVAINCAAFPETLLESELFGHERGAFTGADRAKGGHFSEADGGSLFLDEIGETSLGFQVKLLRALQEGTVRALGATRETRVDVRVIAATNRDLAHSVETGQFRRDLYYRLNVFPIPLPPLRARSGDVAPLARAFLEAERDRADRREPPGAARGHGVDALAPDPGHRLRPPPGPRWRDAARDHAQARGLGAAPRPRAPPRSAHRDRPRARHHTRGALQEAQALRPAVKSAGSRPRPLRSREPGGAAYHSPVLGIETHGSVGGSGLPCCKSSIEMPSGERTNAM